MRRDARRALLGVLALALAGAAARRSPAQEGDQAPLVERVEIRGNAFLPKETLLFYVSTKAGDRYDERRLKDDFRRLWDTGFLDDLRLDAQDTPSGGKAVVFTVRERRRIQIVDYRGSKALSQSTIEDELKKREAEIRVDTFYDLAKVRRAEQVIKQMLDAKGRAFGTVKHDTKTVGGAGLQVSFIIDDGAKVKVKQIEFEGNRVFSDGALRGALKKIKPAGFWNLSWLGGKSTYTEEKWSGTPEDPRGDHGRLEDYFLNRGYVTATVGNPVISYVGGKEGKKPEKYMKLTIPVSEGERYRVGELKFEGLTVFKEEGVRPLFKLKSGDVYKESAIKKGYEKLRDVYGAQGYFAWTAQTKREPDPARKLVDVTLAMEEDKRYYVGRIKFTGNDTTRDKVIRREVYLNEGEVFNTEALKLSIRRINQLGYFRPMEGAPDLGPSALGEDKLDVTFRVEEQNRNQFTFGGGVSGLEGVFLNASFQTTNFLGLGETVSAAAQRGARSRNYQLAVTEPYFLDRNLTVGFDLFRREITYQSYAGFVGFSQWNQGFAVTSGLPVGHFSRAFASYSYQIIDIFGIDQDSGDDGTDADAPAAPTLEAGRRFESQLTPSWVRNTVDNPFLPRKGTRYTGSFQFVGGPLGGTVNYWRPTLETVFYRPFGRRMALGLRGEASYIRPFGSTQEIPYYQRIFLGGETQIRGYDVRSVAPFDASSSTALGGNKSVLFNAEWYFDVAAPLRLLLFFDAGEAYLEGQGINWRTLRTSTGVELRFLMPVLNVPFRLIYAYNANRDYFQPPTAFKFAVGTTF